MHNHEAHVPVVLNVPDDFTGRVLVYLDKGKVKSQCRLRNNEICLLYTSDAADEFRTV